jgi:phosphoglucosamine mutase
MAQKRKYFGTDGVRGRFGVHPVTIDFAMRIGYAVGIVLAREGALALIGRDTRRSGEALSAAVFAGLSVSGVDVIDLGVIPTPAVALLIPQESASVGVVVSASHNPHYDNGIKLFSDQGEKVLDRLELEIEQAIDLFSSQNSDVTPGIYRGLNSPVTNYVEICLSKLKIKCLPENLTIVVDCANGAMTEVVKVLEQKTKCSLLSVFSEPNGFNINESCGAVHTDALQNMVRTKAADMGVAFDGDGDRLILVDSDGCVVDGDCILYIIASYLKSLNIEFGGVVGTIMTNLGVELAFKDLGVQFSRSKVGDRYVLERMREMGWLLGGEASGHVICKPWNTTGDALIAFLLVVRALDDMQVSLKSILSKVEKVPQHMINVPLNRKFKDTDIELLKKDMEVVEQRLGDSGRLVLRPSGTEPLLRVMVECKDEKTARKEAEFLVECIKEKIIN